ncbi:MAG: hypothetical protein Q3979_06115 [Actinomycetaceae bacterium]|nr:hypothetical protein [Actinomycetaceae bacterium]
MTNQASQTSPSQSPSGQGLGRAASAEEWFATLASAVVRDRAGIDLKDLSQDEVDALEVGTPINAFAFDEVSGRQDSDTPTIVESNYWIAPLLLNGQPVATLGIVFKDGEASSAVLTDNASFAEAVNAPESGARIVVDPSIKGWFIVFADDTISPLDSGAREALAGLMPLSEFGTVRRNFVQSEQSVSTATDGEANEPSGRVSSTTTLLAVLGIVVLLVIGGAFFRLWHESAKRQESAKRDEAKGAPPTSAEDGAQGDQCAQGPRTFLTETGEMVRIYERPKRTKEGESQ